MRNNTHSFIAGWNRGQTLTNNEAAEALEERGLISTPDAVTCFQNGCDDALTGDSFRIELITKQIPLSF